jgi:hypothetical protein
MATKAEIKKVILDIAGHPESGPVKQLADRWADAIVAIDAPAPAPTVERQDVEPIKETRVFKAAEKR